MLVTEIFKTVLQRRGVNKDGNEFTIYYQEAEIKRGNKRPKVVEIASKKGDAYPAGLYTIDGESFGPDRFERLTLNPYFRLQSLDEAIKIATRYESEKQKSK